MPVIVYKTMTIDLFYAQGRRIDCECCNRPFTYITGGVESAQTTGIPVVSNDDKMRETAFKQAIKGLGKTGRKEQVGQATCPHYFMYQPWMVKSDIQSNMGCGAALGIVLAGLIPFIVNLNTGWVDSSLAVLIAGGIVGLIAGVVIGRMLAITDGPHTEEENKGRSKTDDELHEFIAECDEEDLEPFLVWWLMMGNEPGEKQAPVSLGIYDQTAEPILTDDMSTEYILAQNS